jgi:hypothetical protein
MTAAEATGEPARCSFATSLRADQDAVTNASAPMQLRLGLRPRQSHQDVQATNVRRGQTYLLRRRVLLAN